MNPVDPELADLRSKPRHGTSEAEPLPRWPPQPATTQNAHRSQAEKDPIDRDHIPPQVLTGPASHNTDQEVGDRQDQRHQPRPATRQKAP